MNFTVAKINLGLMLEIVVSRRLDNAKRVEFSWAKAKFSNIFMKFILFFKISNRGPGKESLVFGLCRTEWVFLNFFGKKWKNGMRII